jgi:hypothetical protein
LQAQQKEWTSKNDTLITQLNSLKQKPDDAPTTIVKDAVKDANPVKDSKLPGAPKQEGKATNTATGNKQEPIVKN